LLRHRDAIGTPAEQSPGAQLPAEGGPQEPEDGGAESGFDWWKSPEGPRGRGTAGGGATSAARAATKAAAKAGSRAASKAATKAAARASAKAGARSAARAAAEAAPKAPAGTGAAEPVGAGPVPELGSEARVPEQGRGPELEAESGASAALAEAEAEAAVEAAAVFEREQSRLRAAHAEVYRHVHDGEEFQLIRRSYRGFAFPACGIFLVWYLGYIVAAVTMPGLMARPVAGPFNVAWLLGLLQFVTTFLITWLYARNARDRRDRAALGLRWETQDRLR